MSHLLQVPWLTFSSSSSSSLRLSSLSSCDLHGEKGLRAAVVDVFRQGSQYLWFVVSGVEQTRGEGASRPLRYVSFPEKGFMPVKHTETQTMYDVNRFALLMELQRRDNTVREGVNDAEISRGNCHRCRGRRGGVCAASLLHMYGDHVVLFFVMECGCVVFASFAVVGSSGSNHRREEKNSSSSDSSNSNVNNARMDLQAVRWCSGLMGEIKTHRTTIKQVTVPVAAMLDCTHEDIEAPSNSTTSPCVSSQSQRGRHSTIGVFTQRGYNDSALFILRLVFTRVVGWMEYMEITWREAGGETASPWRLLRGFDQFTFGALRFELSGDWSGSPGEVRALHWMPHSRDYQGEFPLLAVLHQYAVLSGDPFLDRLSVCMLSGRRERIPPCTTEEVWAKTHEVIRGSCIDGPWSLDALTLAHPSFLLHATLLDGGTSVHGHDALGVFLRPTNTVYPMSGFLREKGIYSTFDFTTDGAIARPITEEGSKEREEEFSFVLFTENGEVARCCIGDFVEKAVSCTVPSPEIQRLGRPARIEGETLVAVVLAMRSKGDVLFIEVWTSAIRDAKGSTNTMSVSGLVTVRVRTVTLCDSVAPRALWHLYRFIHLLWDETGGVVFVLSTHEEETNGGVLHCVLQTAAVRLQGKSTVQLTWNDIGRDCSMEERDHMRTFPVVKCDVSILMVPPSMLDVEYNVGSIPHAPLQVMCGCTALLSNAAGMACEVRFVISRLGDICMLEYSLPRAMHTAVDTTTTVVDRSNNNIGERFSCKRLSRVQWPSQTNKASVISALSLLFSSNSSNICMQVISTANQTPLQLSQEVQPAIDGRNLLDVVFIVVCRSNIILLSISGEVLFVNDSLSLSTPLKSDEGGTCAETNHVLGTGEEVPSLLPCMLHVFASHSKNCFLVLSARMGSLCYREDNFYDCFFFLLRFSWSLQSNANTVISASVYVVDVLHVQTYGQPLFDFLPAVDVDLFPALLADRSVLCVRELLYCAGPIVCGVPCVLTSRMTGASSILEAFFVKQTLGDNMHGHENHRDEKKHSRSGRMVLDLRRLIEKEGTFHLLAEPTLLRCVNGRVGKDTTVDAVVLFAFMSGFTSVAVLYHTTVLPQSWKCQLLTSPTHLMDTNTETTIVRAETVPFVRFLSPMSHEGKNILGFLQSASGCWRPLVYNDSTDTVHPSRDVNRGLQPELNNRQGITEELPSTPPLKDAGDDGTPDVMVLYSAGELFTLGPCL